jgi:hypothetical protein
MSRSRTGAVVVVLCISSLSLLSAQSAALAAQHGTRSRTLHRILKGPATPGANLWVKRYKGPGNSSDIARALGASPDGSKVFVTGDSGAGFPDYATVHDAVAIRTVHWP